MNKVVVVPDPVASGEADPSEAVQSQPTQFEGLQIEADDIEAAPSGSVLYPLLGATLTLATAALAYGGLWFVLKRFGIIPVHR